MDVQHLEYDDESLVRAALQAAYPTERPIFSQRRGAQIIRAAAVRAHEGGDRRHPFVGGRFAASVAAAFTLLAGTAGAASAALPGQPLYPIKRVVERAMVAFAADDVQAARLELRFAERRLHEATTIPDDTDQAVSSSLSDRFHEHLNAASSLAGDQLAGEVEQLEQSQDEQQPSDADAATPVEDVPADLQPQQEPEIVPPEVLASPSPMPSDAASPQPDPAATPAPSDTAAPTPAPSDPTDSATATPEPSAAPADPSELPSGATEPEPVDRLRPVVPAAAD